MKPIEISQIAVMNLPYCHYTLDYFLESMKRIGIKNIELWAGYPHLSIYDSENFKPKMIGNKIKENNLNVVCLTPEQCVYPINIAARESLVRKKSIEYFTRYIEIVHEIGGNRVMITSGWGYEDEPLSNAWKRAVDSINVLVNKATKEDVKLLFEILLPTESNIVNNLDTTNKMLNEFQSPSLECCIDTVPAVFEGKNLDDFFKVIGKRITHIHLNDGSPTGHLVWGDGTQNLNQHLNDLSKNNYSGFLTLELEEKNYRIEPEYHIRRGVNYIKKFLNNS